MARDFNGTTDRIDYGIPFNTAASPITISMWVYFDILTPGNSFYLWMSENDGSGGFPAIIVYQYPLQGTLALLSGAASINMEKITGLDAITTGAWTSLIVTHDGVITTASSAHIYVNGSEPSTSAVNGSGSALASNTSFQVGGRSGDDNRNFNGRIAEIAAWNRVLSAGEIVALADRYAPSHFPKGLKWYPDLIRSPNSKWGSAGRIGTLDGTSVIAHPPMRYPSRTQVFNAAAAAAAASNHRITGGGWGGRVISQRAA